MHPSRSDELFLLITTAIIAFGAMRSVAVVILFTQVFLSSIFGGGIEQLLCSWQAYPLTSSEVFEPLAEYASEPLACCGPLLMVARS